MAEIDPVEFRLWARYIHDISGISLGESKSYLIETRLGPLLQQFGCKTFSDLYHKSRQDQSRNIEKHVIDQISTNETQFFRDSAPFDMLKYKILPDLMDARMKNRSPGPPVSLKVWSAGCSTGQEVYSIAMALHEILSDINACSIMILGTDISGAAITRASRGVYNAFELERGLDSARVNRYFVPEGRDWKIRDEIRGLTTFRKMNFMQPFIGLGRFDIVFCRNVAIYFEPTDRKKLFQNIGQALLPGGYLIIGATESLSGIAPQFEPRRYLRSVFYQLNNTVNI